MTLLSRPTYSVNINELTQNKLKEAIDKAIKERDVNNSSRLKSNILKARINVNEIEKTIEMANKECF